MKDQNETDKDTKFVKEENEPTRKYIFQKNGITKTGFAIIILFLILIIIGIYISGIFFENTTVNP